MNQLARDLRAAKALIDTPEKWTQRAHARTVEGYSCDSDDPKATSFCSLGAIYRTVPVSEYSREDCLRGALRPYAGNIAHFNDNNTHADVMAAWDKAIADAEAES